MATHSSVLAWRIPGTAEPGGLPSMGSHRVGRDWRDLAAAWVYLQAVSSVLLICVSVFCTSAISSVHLVVCDSETPWTAACQASLSITNSWSLLKLMFIESVMPSNHLILCLSLLLLPSIFPSIRVFSNESVLPTRWPKYCSFSFSINPSNEYSQLISFRIDRFGLAV